MSKVNLNELSAEQLLELEQQIEARKKQERTAKIKAREAYEANRDALVADLVKEAKQLNEKMAMFKSRAIRFMEEFKEMANEYGDIKSSSKGGFSLRHSVTQEMVSFDRNATPEYDERAASAEELLKEFLEDTIKTRDVPTYRTITALMAKNKAGDFTPSRIGALLTVRDNYTDSRWVKAMELFEESFRVRDISYNVSFFAKDGMGKDQPIKLTFASLPVTFKMESNERNEVAN